MHASDDPGSRHGCLEDPECTVRKWGVLGEEGGEDLEEMWVVKMSSFREEKGGL